MNQNTINGTIDEFLAFDSRDSKLTQALLNGGSNYTQNSIKEDLIHSIFDDLWAEVYLKFDTVVSKVSQGNSSEKA